MEKQKKTLLVLVVVLIVCVLAYFGATKWTEMKENEEAADASSESITVASYEESEITGVSYSVDGTLLSLSLNTYEEDSESVWEHIDGDAIYQFDTDKVSTMLSYLTSITADSVIEDPEDITQYGFSTPTNEITITTEDGSTTYTIGSSNEITGSYYLMVDYDESKVYVIDSSILTACGYTIDDLMPEEDISDE